MSEYFFAIVVSILIFVMTSLIIYHKYYEYYNSDEYIFSYSNIQNIHNSRKQIRLGPFCQNNQFLSLKK